MRCALTCCLLGWWPVVRADWRIFVSHSSWIHWQHNNTGKQPGSIITHVLWKCNMLFSSVCQEWYIALFYAATLSTIQHIVKDGTSGFQPFWLLTSYKKQCVVGSTVIILQRAFPVIHSVGAFVMIDADRLMWIQRMLCHTQLWDKLHNGNTWKIIMEELLLAHSPLTSNSIPDSYLLSRYSM